MIPILYFYKPLWLCVFCFALSGFRVVLTIVDRLACYNDGPDTRDRVRNSNGFEQAFESYGPVVV